MSWDKLSMSERADIIKLAVQSGIKDLYAIRDTYNEFAKGGEIESPVENSNIYAGGSYLDIAKQHIKKNEDWLAKPYRDAPKGKNWRSVGYGFNDSGFRNKYPQGISKHYENGITEAQAEEELNWFLGGVVNHLKKVYGRKWDSFNDNQKAAIIDTYYQRPASVVGKGSQFYKAVMAGDKNAGNYLGVAGYSTRNKDRRRLFGASQIESVTPTQEASIAAPIPSTTDSDESYNFLEVPQLTSLPPTAYTFGSLPTVEDIARQTALEPPTPEELRRQERHEKLERFQNVMGLMSRIQPSVQSSHLGNIASVLGQQSSAQYFSDGGSIHIKPENRGKFTRLKERTGHSASWFKENGTPAQKKMAVFALNSRHWKHGLGGNLFDDGGKKSTPFTVIGDGQLNPDLVYDNFTIGGKPITLLSADYNTNTGVVRYEDGKEEKIMLAPNFWLNPKSSGSKKLPMQSDFFEGITNQAANERADEHAAMVAPTAEDLFTIGTLGGLNNLSPTQWVRRAYDLVEAIKGNMSWDNFVNNWFYGNNGIVSDKYAQEHPYASAAINLVGDAGAFGLGSLTRPMWNATKNNAKAFYNNLTMDLNSVPGSFYHGSPSRTIEKFIPGKDGGIYFTPTKRAARGYTGNLGTGRVYEANLNLGDNPVVVDAGGKAWNAIPEEAVAKAFGMPKEKIYEQIGHYNAGAEPWYSDFLKPFGYSPNTRSYAVDQIVTLGKDLGKSSLTIKGAKDSGKGLFGWRQLPYDQTIVYRPEQVSLLKSAPQITAESAANYPGIMADVEDFSYKGSTYNKDLLTKLIYNDKIHGKPMYPTDEGVGGFSKSVQTGIPETEYNELLHDVVGRNVREFKQAGLDDAQISNYIDNAKDAMNNVRIGMYSNSDYIKGGWEGFGGFYDSEGNFISVNTGSPLTRPKIVKHEGRHLLDHKVDDEILMPTSENFSKDFDSDMAFSTMQKVKQNQNMILHDAYDNDFVTLPSKEGFNEGLEGYSNMDREAITTNLDSRNELLGSKAGWDLDITDKIIDKMPDNAIFEAVEKANGYGRRFIKFLRENNKLTPQKAQQFREAMKHVGAYIAPTFGVGAGAAAVEE